MMSPAARKFMGLTRTVHIYLTMLACLVLLFFGLTGFFLNHGDWFGLDEIRTKTVQGMLPETMLDPLDKLAVVEALRAEYGVAGTLAAFEEEEGGCRLVFKRPGARADVTLRADGVVEVTSESRGTVAVLTDLHKGASAGAAWRWVIDATSLLLVIGSLSGLLLWISLPRRRKLGLAALAAGLVSTLATYALLVP